MSTFRFLLLAGAALATVSARGEDPLAAIEERFVDVIARAEPSVVSVIVGSGTAGRLVSDPLDPFGPGVGRAGRFNAFPSLEDLDFLPERFGAGVVIADESGKRFVLTNQHLVQGGPVASRTEDGAAPAGTSRIYVRFSDRRGYYAEIHAADPRSDLAVLRLPSTEIDGKAGEIDGAPPLVLPVELQARRGQFVFVFGNPYAAARDGSATVGWGIIGNVLRRPAPSGDPAAPESQKSPTIHHYGTLLQLDCRLDLGFSGGPVINREGELVGLTTSLAALEGYESTAGFAIPIDAEMRRVIGTLLQGHEVEYGFLGVEPIDVTAEQFRMLAPNVTRTGGAVRAGSVKAGSPAERTGLKIGDLILAIDDIAIRDTADLMRRIGLTGPGTEVVFTVVRPAAGRGGETLAFRPRLDKWPVANERDIVATVPRHEPWRGLRVDYATARSRFLSPQLDPYPQGVVVLESTEPIGEPEAIKAGDFVTAVGDQRVETPDDFYNAVRGLSEATLKLADGRRVTVP